MRTPVRLLSVERALPAKIALHKTIFPDEVPREALERVAGAEPVANQDRIGQSLRTVIL